VPRFPSPATVAPSSSYFGTRLVSFAFCRCCGGRVDCEKGSLLSALPCVEVLQSVRSGACPREVESLSNCFQGFEPGRF
jgi:hypothetical protein